MSKAGVSAVLGFDNPDLYGKLISMTTQTATQFHVTYTFNGGRTGGRITVTAADKAAAAIEAPRAMVRFAKGYEAKWGVAYSHNGTDPASYVVTGVRKAPARRAR